jgi:hypothetical protein
MAASRDTGAGALRSLSFAAPLRGVGRAGPWRYTVDHEVRHASRGPDECGRRGARGSDGYNGRTVGT